MSFAPPKGSSLNLSPPLYRRLPCLPSPDARGTQNRTHHRWLLRQTASSRIDEIDDEECDQKHNIQSAECTADDGGDPSKGKP